MGAETTEETATVRAGTEAEKGVYNHLASLSCQCLWANLAGGQLAQELGNAASTKSVIPNRAKEW